VGLVGSGKWEVGSGKWEVLKVVGVQKYTFVQIDVVYGVCVWVGVVRVRVGVRVCTLPRTSYS